MSNRKRAKELREKQAAKADSSTREALASSAENKQTSEAVTKLQDNVDNIKSQLEDVKSEKEEIEAELDTVKARNAELEALQIQHNELLEASKTEAQEEVADLYTQIATLKAEVTKLKKAGK